MLQGLPCHISELIHLLNVVADPEMVMLSFVKYLSGDPFLYSVFLELSYNPSKGEFEDLPGTDKIIFTLESEYSGLPLPCKRSFSDFSESSYEKNRCSKGLKILSARVKSILLSKKLNSYREVAQELIKDLNIVSKTEEKNILRRVYDALNVLIAAGVVRKRGKEYCWTSCPKPDKLIEKRKKLSDLTQKLNAAKALIKRNSSLLKPDSTLSFPLFFLATEENENNLIIESNRDSSTVRVKCKKVVKIFEDVDILSKLLGDIPKNFQKISA
jgi:hypothetical protein